MSKRVLITGGTGFLGRHLAQTLSTAGYEVIVLSRNPQPSRTKLDPSIQLVYWDGKTASGWLNYLDGAFAIINLTGENIFSLRWSQKKKIRILTSRLNAGKAIEMAVQAVATKPEVLIQISGIGYYGDRGLELLDEKSTKGSGFMAGIAEQWEQAVNNVAAQGVRLIYLRTGLVLEKSGGFLKKVMLPFRFFAGGHFGNGAQWMSWIHLADLIAAMRFLLEKPGAAGVVNAVSPNPVTARDFSKILGKVLRRPSWLHVPGFMLRLIFGELAQELILSGQRVQPQRLLDLGFQFNYPTLKPALENILKK